MQDSAALGGAAAKADAPAAHESEASVVGADSGEARMLQQERTVYIVALLVHGPYNTHSCEMWHKANLSATCVQREQRVHVCRGTD